MSRRTRALALALAAMVGVVLTFGGCTADGVAGEASAPPPTASNLVTEADAAWAAGMAEHHDQAVALAELAVDRARDAEVLASASRIAAAQAAEAEGLRAWLGRRGLDAEAHHGEGDMPGEISATAFARAEAAHGGDFDRLFVDTMIRHHEGAVTMCEERLEVAGDAAVTRWARTVATGQTIELDRLRTLAADLR